MRVVLKGLAFVLGAVLCYAAVHATSEAAAPVHPEMRARLDLFEARRADVEAVTVGNSHAGAIDFAALGVPGMHFWSGGQDLFEAAFLARHVARRAPRLRWVLVPASYRYFELDNALVESRDLTGLRREIYARTGLAGFIAGDFDLWLRGKVAPVARSDHWAGVAVRPFRAPRAPGLNDDGIARRPEPAPMSPEALAAAAAASAAEHHARARESVARDPDTPARATATLARLAADLERRGVVLVLYTPPYDASYRRHFPRAASKLRAARTALLARHRNVLWLDYSTDSTLAVRDFLLDGDHVNARGATALSRRLGASLRAADPRTPDDTPAALSASRSSL